MNEDHLRTRAMIRMVIAWILCLASVPLWVWVVVGIRSGVTDWLFPAMLAGMTLDAIAWSQFWAGLELRRMAEDWDDWRYWSSVREEECIKRDTKGLPND